MSLLGRLFVLVAIAVLPAIAILGWGQFEAYRARVAEVHDFALRQSQLVAAEQDRLISGARELMMALADLPVVGTSDHAACSALFRRLIAHYPAYGGIMAVDADGNVYCSSVPDPQPAPSIADRAYFQAALDSRAFLIGDFIEGRLIHAKVLPLAYPIVDPGGVRGMIVITLRLDWLARNLAERPWTRDLTVLIADRNGTILVRLPDQERWVGQPLAEEFRWLLTAEQSGAVELVGVDGVKRVIGYSPVTEPPVGLYIGVGLSSENVLAAIRQAFWRGVGLLLVGTALALAVAWVGGTMFIRRPVDALVTTARQWSRGDYGVRARLRDAHSEIGQLGATFDDMAAQLERRERELREATRAKTRLLAATGHDFKQPLHVIAMNADLLASRPGDTRILDRIHRMIDRLGRALDQLLIASRIELGTLQPAFREFAIAGALAEARDICAGAARDKEIEFRVLPCNAQVRSDPEMLLTILINLIGNAIKYTDQGRVLVGCRRHHGHLKIHVIDTGIGIPQDQLPRIFEEFHQLAGARREGYGLGLSIVRQTADLLGHGVTVRSTVGRGSCFTILLPLAEAGARNDHAPPSAATA